ncbi:MAG TPA: hypothetical protein PLP23_20205 [Panacibacter sp.]|nr:hypothetical protein [Panacibacter sp.]
MQQLFNILIILHVAGGTLGLICGTVAAAVIKGKKAHILNGKLFSIGMITAAVSALVISNLPTHENLFLFAVGGFTFYMVTTGYRIVWLKRNNAVRPKVFTALDYALFAFGVCFSAFLLYMSVKGAVDGNMFSLVPGVFGLICLNFARMDYQLFMGKETIKQFWITSHITRMMGALIASCTAFLVVNVQIDMQWILWLLPSALGGFLIRRFLKKFAPKKNAKAIQKIQA